MKNLHRTINRIDIIKQKPIPTGENKMAELIVALDVDNRREAEEKIKLIGESVGFYKIGLELFTAEGPDVVYLHTIAIEQGIADTLPYGL